MQFAKFFPSFPTNGINNLSKSKAIPGTANDEVPPNSFREDTLYYVRKPRRYLVLCQKTKKIPCIMSENQKDTLYYVRKPT